MKKSIFKLIIGGFLVLNLTSCIAIQSVSISEVKPTTGTEVQVKASGAGFLHLGAPRGIAQKAVEELKAKGAVDNISTVLTMREWGIIQYYRVIASGTTSGK